MSHHDLCCIHPSQRTESPSGPSPPARPLQILDNVIFAAAALPGDHPHALKFLHYKKPPLDAGISRSPNLREKIKLQFRRQSTKALESEDLVGLPGEYDADARAITSTEVLGGVEEDGTGNGDCAKVAASEEVVASAATPSPEVSNSVRDADVRASVMKTFEWLKPLLQQSDELTPSRASRCIDASASTDGGHHALSSKASASTIRHPAYLPSQSVPNLLHLQSRASPTLRRTQTVLGLNTMMMAPIISAGEVLPSEEQPVAVADTPMTAPGVPGMDATASQDSGVTLPVSKALSNEATVPLGPHLHTMDISQQLRSMSQLSDTLELAGTSTRGPSRNHHQRQQSDIGALSHRSRHSRHQSAAGTHLTHSRVVSLASSSLYSCPPDTGTPLGRAETGTKHLPYDVQRPTSLDAACLDWPLQMPAVHDGGRNDVPIPRFDVDDTDRGKLLSSTPDENKASGSTSFVTAVNHSNVSVKLLSPPERSTSIPSKGSSSSLTIQSKSSRFFERFSPPKRLVKKRRSLFKFLRPGSLKHEGRSISTPTLIAVSQGHMGIYEGPADDAGLLTVQYELEEQPITRVRAASMNQLGGDRRNTAAQLDLPATRSASVYQMEGVRRGTGAQLDVPDVELIRRRPSLADYERTLTVVGDDRRRPSAIDLGKLQELQEEDRKQSMHLLPTLSRATRLNDEPEAGLMASALMRNQGEKALFRSASKQKEALGHAGDAPAACRLSDPNSDLDDGNTTPCERKTYTGLLPAREDKIGVSQAGKYLSIAPSTLAATFQAPALLPPASVASRRASSAAITTSSIRPHNMNKIGTSLSSWSRYPSHNRADRCSSAGRVDAVLSRDFAFDVDHEHITSDDGEPDLLEGKAAKRDSKRAKIPLHRRSSTMFSGLMRYYSNIFSAGSGPQNRRSSVMTGGWLANPDLEMLPPTSSAESASPHHDHHLKERLHHLEEQMVQEVEHLEKEAEKLVRLNPAHTKTDMHASNSPFRQASLFVTAHAPSRRESAVVGPMDDMEEDISLSQALKDTDAEAPPSMAAHTTNEHIHQLDGAADDPEVASEHQSSKAAQWSAVYQECLIRPPSTEGIHKSASTLELHLNHDSKQSMPPPMLKSTKARSPVQPKPLDAQTSVRRFPSVTVVDDRKGHSRSVSLISVKFDGTGVLRSSTHNLLQLIEAREKAEREKLLGLVGSIGR